MVTKGMGRTNLFERGSNQDRLLTLSGLTIVNSEVVFGLYGLMGVEGQ